MYLTLHSFSLKLGSTIVDLKHSALFSKVYIEMTVHCKLYSVHCVHCALYSEVCSSETALQSADCSGGIIESIQSRARAVLVTH